MILKHFHLAFKSVRKITAPRDFKKSRAASMPSVHHHKIPFSRSIYALPDGQDPVPMKKTILEKKHRDMTAPNCTGNLRSRNLVHGEDLVVFAKISRRSFFEKQDRPVPHRLVDGLKGCFGRCGDGGRLADICKIECKIGNRSRCTVVLRVG